MNATDSSGGAVERRAASRKYLPFPVMAKGRDPNGVKFECAALLRDIGEGGARMHLSHPVEEGSTIEISFRVSSNPKDSSSGPLVSANGSVLRVVRMPLGTCDVAVRFSTPLCV